MIVQVNKKLTGASGELTLNIATEIKKGSFITIYGESGAGKTSLLRMLAGFMKPDSGEIKLNDEVWFSSAEKIFKQPQERKIGFVFQDYALFPNMTVRSNLEYALSRGDDKRSVNELIEIIQLGDLQHRTPETLSGGQKQRVALARAVVRKPELLLLDEPFSALDKKIRSTLQDYILAIHKQFSLTTILVSHDAGEIFKLSDEILLLQNGKIVQRETPARFYSSQEVSAKFKFMGEVVAIEKADVVYIVSIIIGNNLVKVVADKTEAEQLIIGDDVLVASKAFNPIIQKVKKL